MTSHPSGGGARSSARLAAVQALYEMDMAGIDASLVLDEFLKQRWTPKPGDETHEDDQKLSDILLERICKFDLVLHHGLFTRAKEYCRKINQVFNPIHSSLKVEIGVDLIEIQAG